MFAGRFTLEDAEAVCDWDEVAASKSLARLSSLVDKSLVMKEDGRGFACYRLHETMREYAGVKLDEAGERESAKRRFVDYYVSRCRRSAAEARHDLVEWLEWADLEIDNIRSVLRQCVVEADVVRGADLAASLGWYWMTRALAEGVRWLDEVLASGTSQLMGHAHAHFMRGFLAVLQSDPATARPELAQATAAARAAGLTTALAHSLSMASVAERIAGDRSPRGSPAIARQPVGCSRRLKSLPRVLTTSPPRSLSSRLKPSSRSSITISTRSEQRPPRGCDSVEKQAISIGWR